MGGEQYSFNSSIKFCRKNDIKKDITASYTPQENGVVERKNRSIVEIARSMMKEKGLPTKYWVEAIIASICLRNRRLINVMHDKIPLEA